MTASIAVVCEARGDFLTATDLADQVICEAVDWIEDSTLGDFRSWRGERANTDFLLWREVHTLAQTKGIRVHGDFGGQRQAADAQVARKALLLLHASPDQADAVLLIRDDDGDEDRKVGLNMARDWARERLPALGPVIIGLAHPRRECWVLVGFHPGTPQESQRLVLMVQGLTFDPCREAHRLNDRHPHEHRSAKRVLAVLVEDDSDRERDCWMRTSLPTLEALGERVGLTEYLKELNEHLVPLLVPTGHP